MNPIIGVLILAALVVLGPGFLKSMSNQSNQKSKDNYAIPIIAGILLALLAFTPIDKGQLYNDIETAHLPQGLKNHFGECSYIDQEVAAAGGAVQYWANSISENRDWQKSYRAGETRMSRKQWRKNNRQKFQQPQQHPDNNQRRYETAGIWD